MDTDDLSNEAYKGIIFEAEKFDHSLTLRFGVLAKDCEKEEDYFKQAEELIEALRNADDIDLEWVFSVKYRIGNCYTKRWIRLQKY